jgi:hypothetical protein
MNFGWFRRVRLEGWQAALLTFFRFGYQRINGKHGSSV